MLSEMSSACPSRYTPYLTYFFVPQRLYLQRPELFVESSHTGHVRWLMFSAPIRWLSPISKRFLWCLPLLIIVCFSTLSWRHQEGKQVWCWLIDLMWLEQCLTHYRYSMNICWMFNDCWLWAQKDKDLAHVCHPSPHVFLHPPILIIYLLSWLPL